MQHQEMARRERATQITEWLKEWGEEPPSLNMPDFEEAYRKVRDERARRAPPKCRLLRRLVKNFYDDIQSSLSTS